MRTCGTFGPAPCGTWVPSRHTPSTPAEQWWGWLPAAPNGSTGTLVVLPKFGTVPDHHAEGINDAGDVVGWGETAQGVDYALLWRRNPSVSDPTAPNSYLAPIDLGATLHRRG